MHTRDVTEENFRKLAALFPNAVTETAGENGEIVRAIDADVTEEVVTAIAKAKPFYVVFRYSGMATDAVMTNFEQIFETHSPQTVKKVL